jgi:hypothetical protein
MAIYKKTVRTGKFAKAGEDFKDGDRLTILDEGVKTEGTYGFQDVFKVRVPSGEELSLAFNKTTLNNLIDAFGADSLGWIGKEVKVWRILQNVQGKMVRVNYLSDPAADIDEDGNFYIPGKQDAGAGDVVAHADDEIRPEDIGF